VHKVGIMTSNIDGNLQDEVFILLESEPELPDILKISFHKPEDFGHDNEFYFSMSLNELISAIEYLKKQNL
jgi:hypothetical protein